jgi:DNA adenine methylase
VSVSEGARESCFLRWAGGKRWLAPSLKHFFHLVGFERYIEPFLGGGSVFFELAPSQAILADCNGELVNAYRQVQRHPDALARSLRELEVSKEVFDKFKNSVPRTSRDRAIRFIYLNGACFNGLYRTNQRGKFNVPFGGGRGHHSMLNRGCIHNASSVLRDAQIFIQDFEESLALARSGDMVYCDPAYTVAHGNNGFVRYNENVFSWGDQRRLRAVADEAVKRGAVVIISNAAHRSLDRLYYPYRPLTLHRLSRVGAVKGRGVFDEYLFVLSRERKLRGRLQGLLGEYGILRCASL